MKSSGRSFNLLDLVIGIRRVVNDTVNLLVGSSIDVCQKPVAHDVGLNTPRERKAAIRLDKIDELGLWILDRTRSALEGKGLFGTGRLSGSLLSSNSELKLVVRRLQSIDWVREVALLQWVRRDSASVERVSV